MTRVGAVRLPVILRLMSGALRSTPGLFVPLWDATAGGDGGGRYLLDTARAVDLGGRR